MNWMWALSLVIDVLLQPGYVIWIHYFLLMFTYTATIVISSKYKPVAEVGFHYLWNFLILYGVVTLPFLEFGGFVIKTGYVTFGFSWLLSFAVASITSEWTRFWTCIILCVLLDIFQHLLMTIEKISDTSTTTTKEVRVGIFTSIPDGYKLSSEKRLLNDWTFKDISLTYSVKKPVKKSFDYEHLNQFFQDLHSSGALSKIDEAMAKLDEADKELLLSQELLLKTKEPLLKTKESLSSQEPLLKTKESVSQTEELDQEALSPQDWLSKTADSLNVEKSSSKTEELLSELSHSESTESVAKPNEPLLEVSFPDPDVPDIVPLSEVPLFNEDQQLRDEEISFLLDNNSNQTSHIFPSS